MTEVFSTYLLEQGLLPSAEPVQADFAGYCAALDNPPAVFHAGDALSGDTLPFFLTDQATSSLDVAHQLVAAGNFPEFASLLVRSQSSGRGQMRRQWHSPEGNIYAALRLPARYPFNTDAAATAIGGLLAEELNRQGFPVKLKWPNDLLQYPEGEEDNLEKYRKIGGMLLEERNKALIAGIGINLSWAPDASLLRKDYAMSAGILQKNMVSWDAKKNFNTNINFPKVPPDSKNQQFCKKNVQENNELQETFLFNRRIWGLWQTLVHAVFLWYETEMTSGAERPSWYDLTMKHLAFRGKRVLVRDALLKEGCQHVDICEGVVQGLGTTGELLLSTPAGTATIIGGSLSLL